MALFLSTHRNKIDKKGRVSVPARFRSILEERGYKTVVLFPSFEGRAINACDMGVMETLLERVGGFDPFSEDRESDADVLTAEAVELSIDGDGRIIIPADLLAPLNLDGECVFVGRGDSFQIWRPADFDVRMKAVKERARQKRLQGGSLGRTSDD